jgi:hypothetical protein
MVHDMITKRFRVLNSGNTNSDTLRHHRRSSVAPSLGVIHPFQLPVGWNLSRPNNFT